MDTASTDHEGPRFMRGEVSITHDGEGKLWIGVHPPAELKMMADVERVESYSFPMSPEAATELGQFIVDEAKKVARQDKPGPNRHHVEAHSGGKRIMPEQQAHDHSTIDVEHDESGQVWLSVVPSDRYKMTVEGERTAGIAFPLRPDQATAISHLLHDEALKATGQAGPGAN